MIAIIRIHGRAELNASVEETLKRLNIYKKYTCSLIDEKDEIKMGMVKKMETFTCYGSVDDKVIRELIIKRGQTLNGKKINEKDADKLLHEIKEGNWKIKKFFRLAPPVGGLKKSSKLQYPKGILGKHEDISKLLLRML